MATEPSHQDTPTRRRNSPATAAAAFVAVALVVAAAVAVVVTLVTRDSSPRSAGEPPYRSEVPTAPDEATIAPGQRCPASFEPPVDVPTATRRGPLVATGASGAALCTYLATPAGTTDALPVTAVRELADPGSVVADVNALPDTPPQPDLNPGERAAHACPLAQTPMYRVVLTYPDRPTATIHIVPTCGTMEHAGALRYPPNLHRLLESWHTR